MSHNTKRRSNPGVLCLGAAATQVECDFCQPLKSTSEVDMQQILLVGGRFCPGWGLRFCPGELNSSCLRHIPRFECDVLLLKGIVRVAVPVRGVSSKSSCLRCVVGGHPPRSDTGETGVRLRAVCMYFLQVLQVLLNFKHPKRSQKGSPSGLTPTLAVSLKDIS